MVLEQTQSPEADLDREIEDLIGNKMRGTFSDNDLIRLMELQSQRSRLMRPPTATIRRGVNFYHRRFA